MDLDRRQDRAAVLDSRTANGRIRVTARAAGAPLRYFRAGGIATEYAPAGDLGAIEIGAPVELEHGGPVIGRVARIESSADELVCELEITDPNRRVDELRSLYPHVSADYKVASVDPDGAQRGVKILALALVPKGRCGDACSVRQDCDGGAGQCACYAGSAMPKIKIAGKEYVAGSAEAAAAMEAESKRLDAAEARIRAEESKALRARVESVFPDFTIRKDAPDQEILIETVKKIAPGVDLSSASPDYVAGAFAVAIAMALDLKGKADEPGPDDQPEPGAAPAKPPAGPPQRQDAAGASSVRASVFEARTAPAKPIARPAERVLSPSEKAHRDMIARGRRRDTAPVR